MLTRSSQCPTVAPFFQLGEIRLNLKESTPGERFYVADGLFDLAPIPLTDSQTPKKTNPSTSLTRYSEMKVAGARSGTI
jgi:hypothetical protein